MEITKTSFNDNVDKIKDAAKSPYQEETVISSLSLFTYFQESALYLVLIAVYLFINNSKQCLVKCKMDKNGYI